MNKRVPEISYLSYIDIAPLDLGESLSWNHDSDTLYWIDAWRSMVYEYRYTSGTISVTNYLNKINKNPIGSIAFTEDHSLVAGVKGGFYLLDQKSETANLIATVEGSSSPTLRLNDGRCDAKGRFWCISLNTNRKTADGTLWSLTHDASPRKKLDGIVGGNGLTWSPDSKIMYVTDSFVGIVWQFDFDLEQGELSNKRVFTTFDSSKVVFDGATIDSEGNYWVAVCGGSAIYKIDPNGRLVQAINIPTPWPTICRFGGPNLDILYIATATRFMSPEEKNSDKLGGKILSIHGLSAKGIRESPYRVR